MNVDHSDSGPVSGETWAEISRKATEASDLFELIEYYPAGDTATLAMRLHREGLIFKINREILHPLGLALGISGKVDGETRLASEIHALIICDTGGEPVSYDEAATERNERKLREAGHGAD